MKTIGSLILAAAIIQAQPVASTLTTDCDWGILSAQTRSRHVMDRIRAFESIMCVGNPDPELYEAVLFDLLRTENRYIYSLNASRRSPGEGWGDPYYSSLIRECQRLYDRSPSPDRFRRLVSGVYNADSLLSREMAKAAGTHFEWLVATASGHPNYYVRTNVRAMLIIWMARGEGTRIERARAWRSVSLAFTDVSADNLGAIIAMIEATRSSEALSMLEEVLATQSAQFRQPKWTIRAICKTIAVLRASQLP